MRRAGGLWVRIPEMDNMLCAFRKAAIGKAACIEVASFRQDLHATLRTAADRLSAGRYFFGPYRCFMVRDPKPRLIRVAPFEQRVVHHALINIVGPVLDRSLIHHTYACRRGKGQHAALQQALRWTRCSPWYLKMDIERFYDSVDHRALKELLVRRFRECPLLDCLGRLIDSHELTTGCGMPIGNLSSQYFGNTYLDGFDHWLKESNSCRAYLRYMDDMLVFGESPDALKALRNAAEAWLHEHRKLRLKNRGEINATEAGVPFLGYVLRPDRVRLHPRCARRFSRKIKRLRRLHDKGEFDDQDLQSRSVALHAAIGWRNTEGLRRAVARRQAPIKGYA